MSENLLRPSGAKRWLSCPGSVYLGQQAEVIPSSDGLKHAAQGTVAHNVLERCLVDDISPYSLVGESFSVEDEGMLFPATFVVDQEMANGVAMFIDYLIKKGYRDYGWELFAELSMKHSQVPELGGTADNVCIGPNSRRGAVNDLKYGTTAVVAEKRDGSKNDQLKCYGSLVFDRFPTLEVLELAIIQPRRKTQKKILTTTYTREEGDAFMLKVAHVAQMQKVINPDNIESFLTEGECFFCKARGICPIRDNQDTERFFTKLS